jgi:quercetin dioxygenase-like cupin family protein
MHHVGRLTETAGDPGPYAGHSEGLVRFALVDAAAGSVHQALTISELGAGGRIDRHLHAFEEGIYILDGELLLEVAGTVERLVRDDHCFLDVGVPHAFASTGGRAARWLEVSAPQPVAGLHDTVFVGDDIVGAEVEAPYRRGRFDESELPEPSSSLGLAGFGAGNVGGASLKILMGPDSGATQFNLMVVRYVPGGLIKEHDHAFEEGFYFVRGEMTAELDGETHTLSAGDYCWSGVGSMHAFTNRSDAAVLWLETQVPQPPSRYQARFRGEWERLTQAPAHDDAAA